MDKIGWMRTRKTKTTILGWKIFINGPNFCPIYFSHSVYIYNLYIMAKIYICNGQKFKYFFNTLDKNQRSFVKF